LSIGIVPADHAGREHQHLIGPAAQRPAASAAIARASSIPRGPVTALALPALAITARIALASRARISWSSYPGAALTRLVVKTPAALHSPSAATSARSSDEAPITLLVFSPQATAAARSPSPERMCRLCVPHKNAVG
jgi:hypothetical protein